MDRTKKIIVCVWLVLVLITLYIYDGYRNKSGHGGAEVVAADVEETNPNGRNPDWQDYDNKSSDPSNSEQLPQGDIKTGITTGKQYSEKLVADGTQNLLFIGEDKEFFLYDTIGIINIDKENRKVKIIMIPRDTYIEYNEPVLEYLSENGRMKEPGVFKINYAHHIGAMMKYEGRFKQHSISFLADVVKEKFGIAVDDYVKVNVEGFVKIVDLYGGVDVHVPYEMNYDDPFQGLSIHLEKGMQHLDGKQAEGFVRYRQGLKPDGTLFEIGDVGRKKNQIEFIKAFLKQHGTVSKINKVPELMNILGKNLQHSIGFGDILVTYTGMAKDIIVDKYEVESINVNSENLTRINGSSYIVLD